MAKDYSIEVENAVKAAKRADELVKEAEATAKRVKNLEFNIKLPNVFVPDGKKIAEEVSATAERIKKLNN